MSNENMINANLKLKIMHFQYLNQACPLRNLCGPQSLAPGPHVNNIFWMTIKGRSIGERGKLLPLKKKNNNIFDCYQAISYLKIFKYNTF